MNAEAHPVTVDAPAKINLALHVTGRRADGYHLLDSLVVFSRFGDVSSAQQAGRDAFSVDGPFAGDVPMDGGNLVLKARDALRRLPSPLWGGSDRRSGVGVCEATGTATKTVSINAPAPPPRSAFPNDPPHKGEGKAANLHLTKNLPIASGVGGGSSDAAATLKALNRLWNLGLKDQQLIEIARPLGADLPMCIAAKPLIAKGIGDEIAPIPHFPELPIVLVNPGVGVSTPAVFKALASPDNAPLPPLPAKLDIATLLSWLQSTRNNLEPPALTIAPAIGDALTALKSSGAAFARMSGSGATCFGLFSNSAEAARAAAAIRQAQPSWFVVATTTLT